MRRTVRNTWIALASLGLLGIPSLGAPEHELGPKPKTKAETAPAPETMHRRALRSRQVVKQTKEPGAPAFRHEAAAPERHRPIVARRYPYDPYWHHWPYWPHPYWGHRHAFHPYDPWYRPYDPWYRPWQVPYRNEIVIPGDRVLVEVNVDPGKADVIIDGGLAGDARDHDSLDEALWLDAGEHTVVLTAPGYRTLRMRVDLQGGRRYDLRYDLQKGSGLDPRSSSA